MFSVSESIVEDAAVDQFGTGNVPALTGVALDDAGERGGTSEFALSTRSKSALRKLNPHLPDPTIDAVAASLSRPPHPTLIDNNRHFHRLLTDGVPVEYKEEKTGETRGGRARVIDFDNPANNDFLVVRQLTIQGPSGKTNRPDLILYVNGLPLVVPPTSMRETFADQVVPQARLRAALHAESAKLGALRDYLLPRLLSGKVRVGEAESRQEEHASASLGA